MNHHPTQRLRTDPSVRERLRRDLDHARMHTVDFDLEAGLRKFDAALDGLDRGDAVASNGGSATSTGMKSFATKWWTWSVLTAATLSVVWWTQSRSTPSARPSRTPERSETREQGSASSDDTSGGSLDKVTRSDQGQGGTVDTSRERGRTLGSESHAPTTMSLAGKHAAKRRSGSVDRASFARSKESDGSQVSTAAPSDARGATDGSAESAPATTEALPRSKAPAPDTQQPAEGEVEHLERVRHLLTREPARALEAAREGQSTFRSGLFREERAALVVFALARLGRVDEARREAQSYLRAYPRGPFAVPVSELVTRFEDPQR